MGFDRLNIRTRLLFAFGVLCAILLALAGVATYNLRESEADARALLKMERKAALSDEWLASTQLNVNRVLAVAKSKANPDVDAHFKPLIAKTTERINQIQKELDDSVSDPAGKALMADIAARRKAYIDARNSFFGALKDGQDDKAAQLLSGSVLPAAEAYVERQRAFVKHQHDQVDVEQSNDAARQSSRAWTLNVLVLLSVVLGVGVAWSIQRSITGPLERAIGYARAIAQGHLDQSIAVDRSDEIGELLRAFSEMQTALERMVRTVHQTAAQINSSASEVATGNQDLASRTEATASSLEQTASSMEEITATVKQSADSARQANQLASTAAGVAARGGEVVGQVVGTMQDIQSSSQKIADIIGVIDGIAFQTNILALNAAVEAARAGEQGRGFAVVAGEVRSLAQRSANAAKEIKDLITASVEKVQAGTEQVQTAGQTMEEIVASVQRVNDIIGEITAAAGEQSNGIAQVNVAVNQLDQMTQQNAALVEESAAAAQSLRDQASRLSDAVNVFRVAGGASVPDSRPPAAKPRPVLAPAAPPLVANKPRPSSAGAQNGVKKLPLSVAQSAAAAAAKPAAKPVASAPAPAPLKRPALGSAAGGAGAASAASTRVAAPKSADDGDWETF